MIEKWIYLKKNITKSFANTSSSITYQTNIWSNPFNSWDCSFAKNLLTFDFTTFFKSCPNIIITRIERKISDEDTSFIVMLVQNQFKMITCLSFLAELPLLLCVVHVPYLLSNDVLCRGIHFFKKETMEFLLICNDWLTNSWQSLLPFHQQIE